MRYVKKILVVFVLLALFLPSSRALADDTLAHTIKSAIYGGALGGLVASAVVLLTDNPGGNLGYIPTGIGVGVLLGTAYGIATSEVVQDRAFGELDGGRLNLHVPTVKATAKYDRETGTSEVVESMDLLKVRF